MSLPDETAAAFLRTARVVRRAGRRAGAGALDGLVRLAVPFAPSRPAPAGQAPGLPPGADGRAPASLFVLRNNDVGDLLVVTPLFEALRRRFPEAVLAAGVGGWNLDVLRGNPHLSEVLPVDAPWFNKYAPGRGAAGRLLYLARSPQVREIARRRFTVGIDVLGSSWGALLLLAAGIPWRLGTAGYAGGAAAFQGAVPYAPDLHVGRAALRFAELLGAPEAELPPCRPQIFLGAEERAAGERWWAAGRDGEGPGERRGAGPGGRARRLVVGPGGGLAAKRWPTESFVALLAGLAGSPGGAGGSSSRAAPGLEVLVLGGPGEEAAVAAVAAAFPGARRPAAPPPLREVFALVAAADLVVCNSSLLLHVAAAFGKPTVVVLGESFASARQHQAQWGYPGLSHSLGREPGERGIATVGEVLALLREEIAA